MISKPTVDQLNAFFRAEFPQAKVLVEALGDLLGAVDSKIKFFN